MTTILFTHGNIQNTDGYADQMASVGLILSPSDVATFNECDDNTRAVFARQEYEQYRFYNAGENTVAWNHEKFEKIIAGHRNLLHGGRVNGRRLGPSRGYAFAALAHRETGRQFIIATTHAIAKADTTAAWRQPYRAELFRHLAHDIAALRGSVDDLPTLLSGDFNTVGHIAMRGTGLHQIDTPPTYGNKRYDRLYASSNMTVRGVHKIKTRSDHYALGAILTVNGAGK